MDDAILELAELHREAKQQYEMLAAQNTYGLGAGSAKALNESYWLAWVRMRQAEAEMLRIASSPPPQEPA